MGRVHARVGRSYVEVSGQKSNPLQLSYAPPVFEYVRAHAQCAFPVWEPHPPLCVT